MGDVVRDDPRTAGDFVPHVTAVSDPAYADAAIDAIVTAADDGERSFLFVADEEALEDPEHPILVIDLLEEPGRTFRVVPSEAWGVENNLSIASMGFAEFADAVDHHGFFRGFRD